MTMLAFVLLLACRVAPAPEAAPTAAPAHAAAAAAEAPATAEGVTMATGSDAAKQRALAAARGAIASGLQMSPEQAAAFRIEVMPNASAAGALDSAGGICLGVTSDAAGTWSVVHLGTAAPVSLQIDLPPPHEPFRVGVDRAELEKWLAGACPAR